MLSGHGGDELFWGYNWVTRAVGETARKARLAEGGLGAFAEYLRVGPPAGLGVRQLKEWIYQAGGLRGGLAELKRDRGGPAERMVYYDLRHDFRAVRGYLRSLYTSSFLGGVSEESATESYTFPRPWPRADVRITRIICDTYLRENGIAQADRLGMASSVEVRLPLVDYKLVETVIGVRKASPDHELPPKARFKEAVRDLVPNVLLDRPKQGFSPPVQEWHRSLFAAHGASLVDGHLVSAGVFRGEMARQIATGELPLAAGASLAFRALTLEMWSRALQRVVPAPSGPFARTGPCGS
jgi:asparagine synthase (glutamine-hydrolysing)